MTVVVCCKSDSASSVISSEFASLLSRLPSFEAALGTSVTIPFNFGSAVQSLFSSTNNKLIIVDKEEMMISLCNGVPGCITYYISPSADSPLANGMLNIVMIFFDIIYSEIIIILIIIFFLSFQW